MIEKILSLTEKLVCIPSVSGNHAALREVLRIAKDELRGLPTESFVSNTVPSLLISNGLEKRKFKIILNAHLDVVEGNDKQFVPEVKNGRLYGRGTYDMKGAAAVMILLFKELAQQLPYPIALQLVTDEEVMSKNGTQYHITQGIRSDFVLIGENSGFRIKKEAKGMLWIKLQAKGLTAHGGYPWLGDNALVKLTGFLHTLQNRFPNPTQPEWQTTINIAHITTPNTTFNKVPDAAEAFIDIRYIPSQKETVVRDIKKLLPKDMIMEIITNDPPMYISKHNLYLQQLLASVQKVTGKKPHMDNAHATSDVRFYNMVGVPGVEFGALGNGQHADNEWVNIKSLEDYYYTLQAFLLSPALTTVRDRKMILKVCTFLEKEE